MTYGKPVSINVVGESFQMKVIGDNLIDFLFDLTTHKIS